MGLFGSKWQIVKVTPQKVILSNNRNIVGVNIVDGKPDFAAVAVRLPGYAVEKVKAEVARRAGNPTIR